MELVINGVNYEHFWQIFILITIILCVGFILSIFSVVKKFIDYDKDKIN